MANIILKVNTWMSQIPGNGDKSKLQDSSPPHPPPPPTSPESKALTPREGEGCSRHAQPRDGQPGWSEGAGVDRRADRHHQLPHPGSASQAPPGFLQRSLQVCIPQFPLPSLDGRTSGATPSAEQMAGWSTFFIFMQQKKPGWADCGSRSGKRTWASELGSRAKASESTQILTKIINQSIIDWW